MCFPSLTGIFWPNLWLRRSLHLWTLYPLNGLWKKGEFFHKVCVQQHDTTCVFCLPIWLLCYQNKMRGGVNFYHFLKWCSFPWCSRTLLFFPCGGLEVGLWRAAIAGNTTSGWLVGRRALGPVTDAGTETMSSWLTCNWIIEPYWMYCMCTYVLIMIGENKGPSCTCWIMHSATIHRSMIQHQTWLVAARVEGHMDGWMDGCVCVCVDGRLG